MERRPADFATECRGVGSKDLSRTTTFRTRLKGVTPGPLRALLRCGLHYLQRLGRWPIILRQVRGTSLRDTISLLASAFAAPFFSFKSLQAWQDPVLLSDACVEVTGVGRFQIRAFTDDLWHVLPWREREIFRVLQETLNPGETFVDAGANIGVYTILASRIVGQEGRVVSFEMIPETADILRRHVALNECANIRVIEGALAEASGKVLEAWIPEGQYGQASIERSEGSCRFTVTTLTLADELRDLDAVHLMKMDIEGAELGAIKGMEPDIAKVRAIIFENRGASDVVSFLEGHGFSISRIDGNNALAVRSKRKG